MNETAARRTGLDFGAPRKTALAAGSKSLGAVGALGAAGVLALAGCGGGGGSAPKAPPDATLFAMSVSVPNFSGVFLDEDIVYRFSAPVREGSINPDSIQMRTGPSGGIAPFGVFVRGIFMVDPSTGRRVVIDRDQITENLVNRVERTGDIGRISDRIRFDLGFDSDANGVRRPLFDRSRQEYITFVPEVPTRLVLDDTGFLAGATYACAVPGYPSTNTLENLAGKPLLSPNGRVFTSSFTTVPSTAGKLFLGAESGGIPRVIHSDPFNGTDMVDSAATIKIRFSQPLDPRTVDVTQFKIEVVSVPAPYPQIPVSVFLAQERLGRCQVTLTPLNPLPANSTIRVTLDSNIEDLLGQAMNPTVISFFTGESIVPFPGDLLEEFDTNDREDVGQTSANWNGVKPFVGANPGELTAAFAPYAGDGSDGAYLGVSGQTVNLSTGTVSQRVYNYTTFTVPIGATVTASGNFPLVIHCQGDVDISGTINLSGAAGGVGRSSSDNSTGIGQGGLGGKGGAGGGDGGNGAFAVVGGGGNFDGTAGFGNSVGVPGFTGNQEVPVFTRTRPDGNQQSCTLNGSGVPNSFEQCRQREGGGGPGYANAGTDASNNGATGLAANGSLIANGGDGAPAWGDASLSFASTSASVSVFDTVTQGLKTVTLNGIPTLVAGHGGSGGSGGGGEDDRDGSNVNGTPDSGDEGGGGGGGGGGAFQIVSYTNILVGGRILCNGGTGGSSSNLTDTDFGEGAGGSGGAGGTIWLQCRGTATVKDGARVEALGALGGSGYADGTDIVYTAGNGSDGRIRVEDADGIVSLPGTVQPVAVTGVFAPTLDTDSVAWSTWQNTGIFTPDFSAPDFDADVFPALPANGTIKIFMEGAPENVLTGVDDPDTLNSTGLVKVYDSTLGGVMAGDPWDLLDNNKWWRFKVEFHVDAFHTFTDPLPTIRSINFNIDQ